MNYGVEEYYLYDPDDGDFQGWIRTEGRLEPIPSPNGWTSPRLGVTFEAPPRKEALIVHTPDGGRFEPYLELYEDREAERRRADRADRERLQAERERRQAERERHQAEREKSQAQREKDKAEHEKAEAVARAERLAARLRELGLDEE